MKNYFFRILLFALTVPLFFACSTSRNFTAFSAHTGGYHGKKEIRETAPEVTVVTPANQAEIPVARHGETAEASAEAAAPETALNSVASRVQQAATEANVQAGAARLTETKQLNFAEKLVLKKALKRAQKATSDQKLKIKNPTEIAKPTLDQNLKLALVFLIAALIASLISSLVGLILLIVSLVFFLLWVMTL